MKRSEIVLGVLTWPQEKRIRGELYHPESDRNCLLGAALRVVGVPTNEFKSIKTENCGPMLGLTLAQVLRIAHFWDGTPLGWAITALLLWRELPKEIPKYAPPIPEPQPQPKPVPVQIKEREEELVGV